MRHKRKPTHRSRKRTSLRERFPRLVFRALPFFMNGFLVVMALSVVLALCALVRSARIEKPERKTARTVRHNRNAASPPVNPARRGRSRADIREPFTDSLLSGDPMQMLAEVESFNRMNRQNALGPQGYPPAPAQTIPSPRVRRVIASYPVPQATGGTAVRRIYDDGYQETIPRNHAPFGRPGGAPPLRQGYSHVNLNDAFGPYGRQTYPSGVPGGQEPTR